MFNHLYAPEKIKVNVSVNGKKSKVRTAYFDGIDYSYSVLVGTIYPDKISIVDVNNIPYKVRFISSDADCKNYFVDFI